jgi:hypothetical protein
MADNPRYQRQNIMLAETQPLQFADIKESISRSKSLETSLNKISEFAFKSATEQAKKAGAEYAVTNRPTLQQYADAIQNNVDPETLFSEDYTYFGQAAREVQAVGFRTELETEARSEMGKIKAVIKSGLPIDKEEIKASLAGLTNGYGNTLAKISPDQALKFKAAISAQGYELLESVDAEIAKRYVTDNVINLDEDIKNFQTDLQDIIKNNNPADAAIKMQPYINTIKTRVAMLPSEYKLKYANKHQEVIDFAIMDGIVTHLTDKKSFTNDYDVINNLNQGIAGDMTDYFGMLGFDEQGNSKKSKVIDMVRARLNNLEGARTDTLKLQTEQDKKTFNALEADYEKTGSEAILSQMTAMTIRNPNLGSPKTIEDIRKGREAEAEYTDNVVKIKDEIRRGRFDTWDQVLARGAELGVSRKSLNKHVYGVYSNKSEAYLDEQVKDYVDQVVPSGNRSQRAKKEDAVRSEIQTISVANEEYNKSVGKNEKPTRYSDILDSIKEKRKKEVAARSTVNKNKEAYGTFIETKNIKLTLPEKSLANDDEYNMFKQNVMRSKYRNKDEIMKYVDAVRKAEQDEANLK